MIEQYLHIVSQVLLIDLLVEGTVLATDHLLSLLIEVFNLISDSVMNTLIKYSKDIVFFPYIDMDVLKIFLSLEQLPKV